MEYVRQQIEINDAVTAVFSRNQIGDSQPVFPREPVGLGILQFTHILQMLFGFIAPVVGFDEDLGVGDTTETLGEDDGGRSRCRMDQEPGLLRRGDVVIYFAHAVNVNRLLSFKSPHLLIKEHSIEADNHSMDEAIAFRWHLLSLLSALMIQDLVLIIR